MLRNFQKSVNRIWRNPSIYPTGLKELDQYLKGGFKNNQTILFFDYPSFDESFKLYSNVVKTIANKRNLIISKLNIQCNKKIIFKKKEVRCNSIVSPENLHCNFDILNICYIYNKTSFENYLSIVDYLITSYRDIIYLWKSLKFEWKLIAKIKNKN